MQGRRCPRTSVPPPMFWCHHCLPGTPLRCGGSTTHSVPMSRASGRLALAASDARSRRRARCPLNESHVLPGTPRLCTFWRGGPTAVVDRKLNYGRDIVARLVRDIDVQVAINFGPGLGDDVAAVHAAHPAARVVGLEAHPAYVEHLRSKGIDVVACDIERDAFPFGSEKVDLIIANQVFEHVKDVFWILHESARVLRVGGSLVIGVPIWRHSTTASCLRSGGSRLPWPIGPLMFGDIRRATCTRAPNAIDKPFQGGFRLLEASGANFYPLPGALASRAAVSARPGMGILWPFS